VLDGLSQGEVHQARWLDNALLIALMAGLTR